MWCLLWIFLTLLESGLSQPLSIVCPTGLGRSLEPNQETSDLLFMEDPARDYTPNDMFGELQKFFTGIQQFVQHPSSSLNSALNELQSNAKKNHKKQKHPLFLGQKVVLDPFGNFSFALGLSLNLQLTNSIGFTRSYSRSRSLNYK